MGFRMTSEEFKKIKGQCKASNKKNKYRNVRTVYGGHTYDSIKESKYAQLLDERKKNGEIKNWIRQVSFDLPGGFKHRVDFMILNLDGTVSFIEVKGMDLPAGRQKRKMVEELYDIKIQVI